MFLTAKQAKRANAERILVEHDQNSWDGSVALDALADSRFAVVLRNDDYSWVYAADAAADIASIYLGGLYDGESVDTVYLVATGRPVVCTWGATTVEVTLDTGEHGQASA